MTNVAIPPDEVQEPTEKNEPGLGLGHDPERTPMPWNGSASAGFTTLGGPGLRLGADHEEVNVAALKRTRLPFCIFIAGLSTCVAAVRLG
jgi:alpha-glucosidase